MSAYVAYKVLVGLSYVVAGLIVICVACLAYLREGRLRDEEYFLNTERDYDAGSTSRKNNHK